MKPSHVVVIINRFSSAVYMVCSLTLVTELFLYSVMHVWYSANVVVAAAADVAADAAAEFPINFVLLSLLSNKRLFLISQ